MVAREEYEGQARSRKEQAIQMKAEGMKYKGIAEALEVSVDTVKGYFRRKV